MAVMGVNSAWDRRTAADLGADHIFRPRIALFVAALWLVLVIGWLWASARYGLSAVLLQLPLIAFLSLAVYATCIRPVVAIREREVVLRNVLRDITVPWPALREIDTQYALTLTTTDDRVFRAWAAPAPSRFSASRATPSDIKAIGWDKDELPPPASAHLRADSGTAAIYVRRAWHAAEGRTDDRTASARWVAPLVLGLLVSAIATAATLVLA